MARRISAESLAAVRTLYGVGVAADLSDGRLIERFLGLDGAAREAAFRALVDRHGPMVVRTCRGVLKDEHEARDVAQGVFLTLAGRAASVRRRDAIGPWLHRVALRAAVRSRREALRRAETGRCLATMASADVVPRPYDDASEILHEEIDRLPRRSREAVVACDLEGLPYAAAAARLGLPVRTLQSRLHRGRVRLKLALIRRGVGLGLAEVLLRSGVEAATPAAWAEAVARAAGRSAEVAAPSLWLARCVVVLVAATAIAGAGSLATAPSARSAVQEPETKPKPTPPAPATAALLAPLDRDEARRVLREASADVLANCREPGDIDALAIDAVSVAQSKAGDTDGARDTLEAAEKIVIVRAASRKQGDAPDARAFSSLVQLARTAQGAGFPDRSRRLMDEAIPKFGLDPDGKVGHLIARPTVSSNSQNGGAVIWRSLLPTLALRDAVHLLRTQGRREQAASLARRAQEIAVELYPSLKLKPWDRGEASVDAAVSIAAVAILAGVYDDLGDAIREGGLLPEDRPRLLEKIMVYAPGADVASVRRLLPILKEELATAGAKRGNSFRMAFLVAAAGRTDEAMEMLRQSSEGVDRPIRPSLRFDLAAQLLELSAQFRANAGDRDGALATLRLAAGGELDRYRHAQASRTIDEIAGRQAELDDYEGAAETIAAVPEGERTPNVLLKLARGFAIDGREDRAMEFLKQALANWGEPPADIHKAFLENASATRAKLELLILQSAYLDRVDGSLGLIRALPDEQERRTAYGRVVRIMAERGEFARALQLARGDEFRSHNSLRYWYLANGVRWRLEAEGRVNRPQEAGQR